MSAEEAIARAKAIAARLAGTGAIASTTPDQGLPTSDNGGGDAQPSSSAATSVAVSNVDVNSVAEAALAAAFGTGGVAAAATTVSSGENGDTSSNTGSKRKRWDNASGAGT